jgi:hypothetical protein
MQIHQSTRGNDSRHSTVRIPHIRLPCSHHLHFGNCKASRGSKERPSGPLLALTPMHYRAAWGCRQEVPVPPSICFFNVLHRGPLRGSHDPPGSSRMSPTPSAIRTPLRRHSAATSSPATAPGMLSVCLATLQSQRVHSSAPPRPCHRPTTTTSTNPNNLPPASGRTHSTWPGHCQADVRPVDRERCSTVTRAALHFQVRCCYGPHRPPHAAATVPASPLSLRHRSLCVPSLWAQLSLAPLCVPGCTACRSTELQRDPHECTHRSNHTYSLGHTQVPPPGGVAPSPHAGSAMLHCSSPPKVQVACLARTHPAVRRDPAPVRRPSSRCPRPHRAWEPPRGSPSWCCCATPRLTLGALRGVASDARSKRTNRPTTLSMRVPTGVDTLEVLPRWGTKYFL